MRPVKLILPALLVACLLPAQSPIGLGPGTVSVGLLDRFDWYTATASGCSAGVAVCAWAIFPWETRCFLPGGSPMRTCCP